MTDNGEDIIRETFKKLGAAIGVQMQVPDAMIANLGAVLQAQIDLLAELQSTGRLIPAGGMALTAEDVEDVRTAREELRGYRNFTGYGRSHVNQLIAAVDALFPATEPAEEVTQAEGFCSFCGWSRDACARGEGECAPAEPAEEETKADPRMDEADLALAETRAEVACAVAKYPPFNSSHEGYAVLKEEVDELWDDVKANNVEHSIEEAVQVAAMAIRYITDMRAASSPVVPAPTETGPWETVDAIQVGVPFEDKEGSQLVKLADGKFGYLSYPRETPETLAKYAPFVAAAEEG